MNIQKHIPIALIGTIIILLWSCAIFSKKQIANTPPAPAPDPAEVINSPEYIAKHGVSCTPPPKKQLTLKEKIDEADIVVEAKAVVSKEINKNNCDSVKTSYLLLVYKVFKGNIKADTIELTVKGGWCSYTEPYEEMIPGTGIYSAVAGKEVTDFVNGQVFNENRYGVFFLKKNTHPKQTAYSHIPDKYKFTAQWHRNYLWYDDLGGMRVDDEHLIIDDPKLFYSDKNPLMRLYKSIKEVTGKKYKEIRPLYKKKDKSSALNKENGEQLVMSISTFSKDSVPAGTRTALSHLTIYGSGFGTTKGQVRFKNATNGGSNELNTPEVDILHWSNDSIVVHVPSMGDSTQLDRCAGTGVVKVLQLSASGIPIDSVTSTNVLVVPYSIKNDYAKPNYFRPKLMNASNRGGYVVMYDSSFYSNKPALAAFRRALETWRCTTGIYWEEYCEKERLFCDMLGKSGFIRVSFHKPCFGAPDSAIAKTVIRKRTTCATPTDTALYITGQDLIFNNPPWAGFTWHFDSIPSNSGTQFDFETTALHELGHVHLLDHIINPVKSMHYDQPPCNAPNSTIKTLSQANEIAGANFIMSQDTLPNPLCPNYLPLETINPCLLPAVCPPSGSCFIENPALFNQPIITAPCNLDIPLVPNANSSFDLLLNSPVTISASHPYNPEYAYEWDFGDGALVLSATGTTDYGPHEVQWTTTGLKFVTLTVYDDNAGSCYGVAETLWVNEWHDCTPFLWKQSYISNIIQPSCSTPTGSFTLSNDPTLGTLCYTYTILRNDTLVYETTGTGQAVTLYDLLPGDYTIITTDYISGCITTETVILNATPLISGKTNDTQDDETPCFVDLRMRDNPWDTGQEPNYSAGVDGNNDGSWDINSPDDWEDIWASPDLWNCDTNVDCGLSLSRNPRADVENRMGFSIFNAHPDIVSDPAQLHLHYTLANTGEMWPDHWVNFNYANNDGSAWCFVGEEAPNSPIIIPPIAPQDSFKGWMSWWPPNFVAPDLTLSYQDPNLCGLITETDPADGAPKYEICLLARLESPQDPIVGDNDTMPIRDYTLNSNNVVTRNMFLIDPALGPGGGLPPIIAGQPSVILVANSNDEVRYLDILFDKFTNGSVEALQDIMEISFVLAPELWEKWQSTGAVGEGVQVIDEREVKITNMETAKLLNIPFDPREFQPMAIKVTFLTGSGKRESLPLLLPAGYGFRITHQSSNGSPINKPSNCLFIVENIQNNNETAQTVSASLRCVPNPFADAFQVQFYAEHAQPISLSLYDIQGRLVKRIVSSQEFSQGKHNIEVNMDNLTMGMYVCTLTTTTRQISQKVVKVK